MLKGGITVEELVEYIELKKKMTLCTYENMADYSCYSQRKNVLKVGDVTRPSYCEPNEYYVIVDFQLEKDGKFRGYGMVVALVNEKLEITEGATHFSGTEYVNNKLGVDITQLEKHLTRDKIMEEINELEDRIAELQKKLV